MSRYIHERPDWPEFTWDRDAIAAPLADVRHRQGRLLGRMERLGFQLRQEAELETLTLDVASLEIGDAMRLGDPQFCRGLWRLHEQIHHPDLLARAHNKQPLPKSLPSPLLESEATF